MFTLSNAGWLSQNPIVWRVFQLAGQRLPALTPRGEASILFAASDPHEKSAGRE